MTTSIFLGPLSAVSVRRVSNWTGVWFADVDVDLEAPIPPAGPTTLIIGTNAPMVCAVDDRASGIFGLKAKVRVVGGAGGWDKDVTAQHFKNDAGLLSTTVISATAAQVLERATVLIPTFYASDYIRTAGPARRVLDGQDWHVDPTTGTTIVGPRVPVPADPTSVELLDWDPNKKLATLASDAPVEPGTILVDPRFGTAIVRDVEQTWDASGSRALAWCSSTAASRLAGALRKLVEETSGVAFLRARRCRVVAQGPDGRLSLQPVDVFGDIGSSMQIKPWSGAAGVTAKLTPGAEVLLEFENGDPSKPVVRTFSTDVIPVELDLQGGKVNLGGPTASKPVASATEIIAWAAKVNTALNGLGAPIDPLATTVASTVAFTR